MDKFENDIKPGGTLLYDPNGIVRHPERKDINIFKIPGAALATEMGNPKTFNMIILGGFLSVKPIVDVENVKKGLEKSLPERHHKLIPLNIEAIQKGMGSVETVLSV
jgi:2-oxoglutarate ferredoxin oxidoreductase subunit gamma